MTPTLTIRSRSHWVELNTRLSRLSERVSVGVFDGVTEDGDPLPEILAVQEYGTSTIPARPALGPTVRENRMMIVHRLADVCGDTIRGERVPRMGLESLGRDLVEKVRHKILSTNIPPPLAPATVRRKASSMASGVSPDKPWVHTGLLLSKITSRVS